MEPSRSFSDAKGSDRDAVAKEREADKPAAWEMIEAGRYQPRRIKGSLLGRELG